MQFVREGFEIDTTDMMLFEFNDTCAQKHRIIRWNVRHHGIRLTEERRNLKCEDQTQPTAAILLYYGCIGRFHIHVLYRI